MSVPLLDPGAVPSLAERGEVVLVDVRPPADFARAHPAKALSVPFSPRGLGPRVRVALPLAAAVVLIAPDDATAQRSAAQLAEADIPVRGVLAGGFPAWSAAGLPEAAVAEIAVEELPRSAADSTIVDVREPLEWTTGHVPGALLVPLGGLREAMPSIPRHRRVIAICEAGVRSCTAASLLASAGFTDVAHVPAGSAGYRASGLPLAFPASELAGR